MADKVIKPGTGGDQYIPFDKRTGDSSVVYFTRDLSPEGLLKIYDKISANLTGRVGIKLRGNSSLSFAQKKYTIETQDADGNDLKTPLLGMPAESDWVLLAPYNDISLLRDVFATDAEGTAMLPVEGGKWFKEMSVGKSMLDYDSMLALTHFKGHVMGGFGGSNKNIGIGCADGRIGKAMIHTTPGQSDMWDIKTEELMERIAESTKATISFFGKNVAYINVMRNMSVSCDCEGVAAQPVVTPDVGIVASLDILAADQACIDLVYALPEESHAALIERMESRHGLRQLTYMKELNMGNDRYTLIDIDHDDREITAAQAVEGISGGWVPDAYNRIHK